MVQARTTTIKELNVAGSPTLQLKTLNIGLLQLQHCHLHEIVNIGIFKQTAKLALIHQWNRDFCSTLHLTHLF